MTYRKHISPSTVEVLRALNHEWPSYLSVPTLIRRTRQVDVRKRVSEALAAGYDVEKKRDGRYINYRWTA
jgi:hypothetical protein